MRNIHLLWESAGWLLQTPTTAQVLTVMSTQGGEHTTEPITLESVLTELIREQDMHSSTISQTLTCTMTPRHVLKSFFFSSIIFRTTGSLRVDRPSFSISMIHILKDMKRQKSFRSPGRHLKERFRRMSMTAYPIALRCRLQMPASGAIR